MSVALNPSASAVPVESHPLSPDEVPSPGGRTARRRARGHKDHQGMARPVTSYFSAQRSAEQVAEETSANANANSYLHHTYHNKGKTTWAGSVRGSIRKKKVDDGTLKADAPELKSRSSTLSLVWERPSVPLFIVGSATPASERGATTPPGTPMQRPIFVLPPSRGGSQTLHELPPRAASHVLSTPFHELNDGDIQSAVSVVSVLSEEDSAPVTHPYHSALRVLSEAVEKLNRARIELEEGRKKLLEKQAKVREFVTETHEPDFRIKEAVLSILDDAGHYSDFESENGDVDAESTLADGGFSLKTSLSAALSENLTSAVLETRPYTPSSVTSATPPDSESTDRDTRQTMPNPPSLMVSSESRGLIFTQNTDYVPPRRARSRSPSQADASSLSRTPSPTRISQTVTPSRLKSRVNSSASLASLSSTTSRGLGDWMGWFSKGRSQNKEPPTADSATTADAGFVKSESLQATEETGDKVVKPTSTMRLANVLSALRMGTPSPQSSPPPPQPAPAQKPGHKRKISVTVVPKSVPTSAVNSPILGAFNIPPPMPIPPLASTALAMTEQNVDELENSELNLDMEATSMLSSATKEKESDVAGSMQGATLRALSNATRVMTSDPASILVDHGQDVGELVKRLAWELVRNVRDSGVIFKEPAKPKAKVKTPLEQVPEGEEDRRKNKVTAIKNLTAAAAGGTVTMEKARKTSALGALTTPLLGGLGGPGSTSRARAPTMSGREELVPGNTAVTSTGHNGATAPSAGLAPSAGALSVPLESIIPATAKPPTQYLARTYTSLTSPDFRPPSSFAGFTTGRFATRKDADGTEPITDRYGFVYEVSSYDVLLLDRALRANNSAPGCLTGIKVADREEDDDWPAEEDEARAREFEVIRGTCPCVDGVRADDGSVGEGRVTQDVSGNGTGNNGSEAASIVSVDSSKRSNKRNTLEATKPARTLPLSAPLKIVGLDYLPTVEGSTRPVPTHACPNTVRALISRITDYHDEQQARLTTEWNSFLKARRDMKPIKASASATGASSRAAGSSVAAVMLGLGQSGNEDNVEELRQSEGLIGFSQMGLASNQSERKEFGRLVRGGIPLVYRAKVWLECSGALEMAEPGAFRDLLEDAVKEGGVAIAEIEKDVGRTMPLNVFFGGDGVGVDKLRRVLQAYSRRNPSVGYCQGMNLVASTLLLVHANEEDAFWNLACIIEKQLPEEFFSPSLLVSRACPLVLLDYIHDLMPAVFEHLTHLGVDLPAICFSWFLSLFTDCLPVETLFRVWDVFIVDGLDVLFRTALAILRINETELLQAKSVPALYVALESLPTRMWEVDKLLKHEAELRPHVVSTDLIKKRNARVKELQQLAA